MISDLFQSPKNRIARAHKHLRDFEEVFKAFSDSSPHAIVTELDADGVTTLHKVKLNRRLPDDLTQATQECCEALRSALDQAGYACAVLGGKHTPKYAHFPFADSGAALAGLIKGRCKDLPSDIVSLFRSFQPYQGGNDPLWAINKVANTKHTKLVPVGYASGGFKAKRMLLVASASGSVGVPMPIWDSEKQEMIFGRVGPGAQFEYDLEFAFYVAFGDAPVFKGQPVARVLRHIINMVSGIVLATEAECRRIGLLT